MSLLKKYNTINSNYFDEIHSGDNIAQKYSDIFDWFEQQSPASLHLKQEEAKTLFQRFGITFSVYGDGENTERLIPFDLMPRIFSNDEWLYLEEGIKQRVRALNAFMYDVYHGGDIVRAGHMPAKLIYANSGYEPSVVGFVPPHKIYAHIVGTDIVRTGPKSFYVLEDNCRTPSGVSYMLETRAVMMRIYPELFNRLRIQPVEDYTDFLYETFASVAPSKCTGKPTIVILTPGVANSAYYEHLFLADQMGIPLVEGSDLFVRGDFVYMRTISGPEKVDVIYRRIDDDYIDPLHFNPNSYLGIAGLMNAYRSGGVQICSAPGAGISDDKAIYTYVPKMIEFYLGEKPILSNVDTWLCQDKDSCAYVLDNLSSLVVKEVHGSGGYGMLVGPSSSKAEIAAYAERIKQNPDNFIAQPTLALSTCPTFVEQDIAPRHVDLRPFCLIGKEMKIVPGGLTRVALKAGSLVVNSSQGGGVKDSWVLD